MKSKKGMQVKMLIYIAVAVTLTTIIIGIESTSIISIILSMLALYFFPTIIGWNKNNAKAIFVLNLLLGWTFVGWVIALVWAFTKD